MSEVSLSTYPTTVDTFDRYSDLDATTMAMAEIYKGYIDAGQYETAATYLNDHPDLEACGITAEIVNKHSDAIVACENQINTNSDDIDTLVNKNPKMIVANFATAITNISSTSQFPSNEAYINYIEDDAVKSSIQVIGTEGLFVYAGNNDSDSSKPHIKVALDSNGGVKQAVYNLDIPAGKTKVGTYKGGTRRYGALFEIDTAALGGLNNGSYSLDISSVGASQVLSISGYMNASTTSPINAMTYPIGYNDGSSWVCARYNKANNTIELKYNNIGIYEHFAGVYIVFI